jgi:hypothetical protein
MYERRLTKGTMRAGRATPWVSCRSLRGKSAVHGRTDDAVR